MGQFSLVQNEHSGVGAIVASPVPKYAYLQGKPSGRKTTSPFYQMIEMSCVGALERHDGSANAGLDTISGYAEKCGDRHFAGVARWTESARSIADLPVASGGAGQQEPLLGGVWAGGKARASSGGVCAGLPGLGEYIRKWDGAGGIVANSGEAKEIDCYA